MQSVDLFATALSHAGVSPDGQIDGVAWGVGRRESLGWLYLNEHNLDAGEDRYRRELVTIERDGWKLVRSSRGTVEMYDVVRDPGSTHDLAQDEPARARSLADALDALGIVSRARSDGGERLSDEAKERLRALGYVE